MARFVAYPLTFLPRLEEKVWGGRRLARYGKRLPPGEKIGESWELSDVPGRPSQVASGRYAGETLRDLVAAHAKEILGAAAGRGGDGTTFPLLVKLLNAEEDLSIQVHPADGDVRDLGLTGKTEAWVILEASRGARVLHGLAPRVERQAFFARLQAAGRGRLARRETESLFRWVKVAPGDVVFVPAGTIHTIGKGIVLLEVQQTSDVTYRLHDWGRAGDRALHLEDARAVKPARSVPCPYRRLGRVPAGKLSTLVASEYFRIEALRWGRRRGARGALARVRASTRGSRGAEFHILAVIAGEARLRPAAGSHWEDCALGRGDSVLLPAALGGYQLEPAGDGVTVLRVRGA